MAGGSGAAGRLPVPGEITLAHRGVLFLDEFPEFRRDVLETLRQPLEDGRVTISRVAGQVTYPARFQLIAAMNPCKCGWYGTERCTCTKAAVQQYLHRLSGPLLDRIDLQVAVQPVEYAALAARGQASEEHSADIRARVLAARAAVCPTGRRRVQRRHSAAAACRALPAERGCVSYVCGRISATGADRPCA